MAFGQGEMLRELLEERSHLEREIGLAKGRLTQLNQKINDLAKAPLETAYAREKKADGTVTFALDNHIFKAVIGKTVEWDSDALIDIAREIPLETARELFKVKYSMSETIFKGIAVPGLKAKLTIARTVKYGEPKITSVEVAET